MKAIIFGGSGFLGSHLADALSDKGFKVKIFDIEKSKYLKKNQEMIVGDILDEELVEKSIKGCNYVFNFAGISDIDESSNLPSDTILLNIYSNNIILEAFLKHKCKRYIYASTVYVYSNKGGFYRCSKQATELYIEEYHRKYGLEYTILRYGTLYGKRAGKNNSVYKYLKQAMKKGEIEISGGENDLREYINVQDAANLSVEILDEKYANKHITLTGNQSITFGDFLKIIKEILGKDIKIIKNKTDEYHYSRTPYSYSPKSGHKLNSNMFIDLGQGLLECASEIETSERDVQA